MTQPKPSYSVLRELQRHYLQIRWDAICARGDQVFYARTINSHVVSSVSSSISTEDGKTATRSNLPADASPASPAISTISLLLDAASCGYRSRRRAFIDFGEGMLSFLDVDVQYFPESVASFRSRRLAIAIALVYVWCFCALIAFWILRDLTGSLSRLSVPPYGSGIIHLLLSLSVVLAYVLGVMIAPPHVTLGLREGALPSLLPLVLQTPNSQFMSSYAWSSRYTPLVRSLSVILGDCWLDVRELAPGDRVTREIALAAATVRCLVIFFSYEYLRSVNCTLELLTALRYRASPQRTVILIESPNDGSVFPSKAMPLTDAEVQSVAEVLAIAIPGLIVARSIGELLDVLDKNCIRVTDEAGVSTTIEWWARYGRARISRVGKHVRVVPPILQPKLTRSWALFYTCYRRRKGDVAGGFSLISGDGSLIRTYRPLDAPAITMIAVLCVELLVYAHMFVYCSPDVAALTLFADEFFQLCGSLLPLVLVTIQFLLNLRADGSHLHDELLLPLNVAAHSTALRTDASKTETHTLSFQSLVNAAKLSQDIGNEGAAARLLQYDTTSDVESGGNDRFSIAFVLGSNATAQFSVFASSLCNFIENYAIGIACSVTSLSALPQSARRLMIYIFMLDTPESVDAFYHKVHCAPAGATWPTSQIIVICHASVLKSSGSPTSLTPQQAATRLKIGPEVRARWRHAVKVAVQSHKRDPSSVTLYRSPEKESKPALPPRAADGSLATHLRTSLFEYLLIMTGSKAGIDASSPYNSLVEAIFDTIGRKVGAVLQAKRPVVAPPMPAPASKIVRRFTMISRSANTASVLSTQRLVPESPAAITSTLPAHSVTVVANPMRADAGKPVSDIGEVTLTCVQPSELSTEHDPTTATHTADSAVQANPLYLTVREGAELPDPNTEPVDNSVLGGGSRADPRRSTVGFAAMSSRQRGARRKRNIKGDGSTSTPSRPPTDPGLAVVTSLLSSPDISTDDMSAVCSTIPSAGDVSRDVRRQIRSAGAALLPALAQQLSVVQSRQTDERDAETTDTAMAYRAMASLSDHANARTLTNLSRGGLPEQLAQTLRDALEGTAASRAKAVAALPDALWLLSSVCRDRASADGFVNAGGVPLLLSVVKRHAGYASAAASSDDQRLLSPTRAADVALNGCVALAAIADHPGPASALLSGGSLPVLVASCFNPFRVSGMDSSCRPSSSLAEAACHVMLTLLGNAAPPWDPMALCNELCACDAIGSLWAVVYCALGHSDLISPDTSPATLDVSLAAQSLTLLLRILQCAHAVNTVASLAANDIKSLFVALPGAADKANVLHRLLARCNGRLLTGAASGALVDAEEEMALKQVVCQLLQHLPSPNSLSMSDESSTATLFPAEAASGIDNVLAARLINE